MNGNNRPPTPPQPPQEAQLLFQTSPHPELPGKTALIFTLGPMQTVILWPTSELGAIVKVLEEARGERRLVEVPTLGGFGGLVGKG